MAAGEAQPLVEAVGVLAGEVGGQLNQAAAAIGGKADGMADKGFAQALAAGGAGDAHALDQRAPAALVAEIGNHRDLKTADDAGIIRGDQQARIRVRLNGLKGIFVAVGKGRIVPFPGLAEGIVGQ